MRLTEMDEHALVARDGDIYIAAQPSPVDLDVWARKGVKTVVNMRSRGETANLPFDLAEEVRARGMTYAEAPMGGTDGVSPNVCSALGGLLAKSETPVVIHCGSGARVAHAYAAHLLACGRMGLDDLTTYGWPGGLSSETLHALGAKTS